MKKTLKMWSHARDHESTDSDASKIQAHHEKIKLDILKKKLTKKIEENPRKAAELLKFWLDEKK